MIFKLKIANMYRNQMFLIIIFLIFNFLNSFLVYKYFFIIFTKVFKWKYTFFVKNKIYF